MLRRLDDSRRAIARTHRLTDKTQVTSHKPNDGEAVPSRLCRQEFESRDLHMRYDMLALALRYCPDEQCPLSGFECIPCKDMCDALGGDSKAEWLEITKYSQHGFQSLPQEDLFFRYKSER